MRSYGAAAAGALLIAAAAAVRADSGPCTYGLPSVTSDLAQAGGTLSVALVTQAGCAWTATTDSPAVTQITPSAGTGSAAVQVTVAPNPDPLPRLLNVTLGDTAAPATTEPYMINQRGTACTFAIAAPPSVAPAGGGTGSFSISTQPGCGWRVSAADPFITFGVASGAAGSNGVATIAYSVAANTGGTDTRRTSITVTNPGQSFNSAFTQIAQAGDRAPGTPWNVGDVFVGLGSWFSDGGLYRTMNPGDGSVTGPDLRDAYGGTTTGCMIDPGVARGDLFATSWDGLLISRFSDATHQLASALDLTPAGLAIVQRRTGTVPVPYTQNLNAGAPFPDVTYSEQVVFDQSGNFYVGGSMYVTQSRGLGHAYLLKFAKNDDGSVAGCPAKSPCLLDWWRVDAAGEVPVGQDPAGSNALWTSTYKTAYRAASGDGPARTAAAFAAVAPLAASLSYQAGTAPSQVPGPAGVDELDLSSDQHTVFYTSEDNRIRRFDTATGTQLAPLTLSDPDLKVPIWGKAYGFRLLPDGHGHADGSAGLIVAMSTGVFRVDAAGFAIKPPGLNDVINFPVAPGGSHPFSMNLTPDAQSLWVATSQDDSSNPARVGGKVYRFHIPTGARSGPFNVGSGGSDVDIQGLCVKREYTAGVNQCFKTDADGHGVLDNAGNPIPVPCLNPPICSAIAPGIDASGQRNLGCYPPGQVPLTVDDRGSIEGNRSSADGTADLDLRPLTYGHDIMSASNLPAGLSPVIEPLTGYIIGVTGTVSWGACAGHEPTLTLCRSYVVGLKAADGASTSFTWNVLAARPRFVSGFGPAPAYAPAYLAGGLDQTSLAGQPLAAASGAYQLVANGSAANLPLSFSFTCATSTGVLNGAGCDSATGLPIGLSYAYATAVPGVYSSSPDPLNTSRTNQFVVISGTPTVPASALVITATVTDQAGGRNVDPFTFHWTVTSNRPPVCDNAAPSAALWPPNHKLVEVAVRGVTDPDNDPIRIRITSIWQDEPLSTRGSGHTVVADASGIGTSAASVRAERAGVRGTPGEGRIYQINFTASDGKGGSCNGAVFVGIPHDQGQMKMPVDGGVRYDSLTGARIQ